MKIKKILNNFYLNKKEKNYLLKYINKNKHHNYIYNRMILYKNIIINKLQQTNDYIYIEYFNEYLNYVNKIIHKCKK